MTEGALLGLGALAAEPARARVVALRRRARTAGSSSSSTSRTSPGTPATGARTSSRSGSSTRASRTGRTGSPTRSTTPSARLAAWIARRSLMPIDRQAPDRPRPGAGRRGGGRGGSSHHTDPGPHWNWSYYLRLVRRYAGVDPAEREAAPAGRAAARHRLLAREGVPGHRARRVHRRRPRRPRRPATARSRTALNTAKLGQPRLQAAGARHRRPRPLRRRGDARSSSTTRRSRSRAPARGRGCGRRRTIRLRVRPWGAKAARMVFSVDGRTANGRPAAAVPLQRGARAGRSRASHVLLRRRDLGRRPHRRATDPASSSTARSRSPCRSRSPRRSPCRSRSPARSWPTARR